MSNYVSYTEWQVDEVIRCVEDPWYCLQNYVWLEREADLEVPVVPFEPFPKQKSIIEILFARTNLVCNKSRRVGWSWAVAFVSWYLMNFFPGVKVLLLSRTEDDATLILEKVKFIHNNLAYRDEGLTDNFEKAEKASWLAGEIKTDNNSTFSRVFRDHAGKIENISSVVSLTNTDNSGRGRGATFIMMDEYQFYDNDELVWRSMSKTIIGGGWWAVGSTAGPTGTKFHWLCTRAEHGQNVDPRTGKEHYKYLTFHWRESWIPENEVIADKSVATEEDIRSEWELEFISHGNTVFDPANLALCYKPPDEFPEVRRELEKWAQLTAQRQGKYCSGADTIKGKIHKKSSEKDWNAFSAFTQSRVQAAAYTDQSDIGTWSGMKYDLGNGKSVWVKGTLSQLHEEWPGTLSIEEEGPGEVALQNHDTPKDGFSEVIAYIVAGNRKHDAVRHVMSLVDHQQIVITDKETYDQMAMFQDNGPGRNRYSAPTGYNDDLVTTVLASMQAVDYEGGKMFHWGAQVGDINRESVTGNLVHGERPVPANGPMLDFSEPYPGTQRMTDVVPGPGQIDMEEIGLHPMADYIRQKLREVLDGDLP